MDVAALHQNGHEAAGIACLAELDICTDSPDIVLINLSDMDGDPFELAQNILQTSPQMGVLQAISVDDEDDKTRAYLSWADNYLVRSYESDEMWAVVKCLSRRLQRALNV